MTITKAGTDAQGRVKSVGDKWRIVVFPGEENYLKRGAINSITYSNKEIVELPPETLESDATAEDAKQVIDDMVLASELTEDELSAILSLYPVWEVGESLIVDDLRVYDSTLYKVVQAHTTQADWTPDITPAMFTEVPPAGVIPEWVQPTGAQDAYNTGDQVQHDGYIWTSDIDANVWEPGVYGWTQGDAV